MLADQQTHVLPERGLARERVARGLGYADSDRLMRELNGHRAVVSEAFSGLLQTRRRKLARSALAKYWLSLPDAADGDALAAAGFLDADSQHTRLRDFARSPAVRGLSERARQRLDHVLPALIEASAESMAPDAALPRGLALLQAIVRRSSYLALLEEQPAALARLVDVTARSSLLSERLAAHPLLLDELLDIRAAGEPLDESTVGLQLRRQVESLSINDTETALAGLNELKQSLSFRIALAALSQRQSALASARQLAVVGEGLLPVVLELAEREMRAAHGSIEGAGFAVIGYGSLGGRELSFGSDLDLVFLHDASGAQVSDGPRPLEASRYFARLAQKLVSLLATATSAGRLYEVDVRLRPDGAKGLLVSSLRSFSDYQEQRAWTWEQQALTRARAIAGSQRVREGFERIRRQVLSRARESQALRADVIEMRLRMRGELDRSDGRRFDLKQGEGGLVDLEFLLQSQVLALAAARPSLCHWTATSDLIPALAEAGAFDVEQAQTLATAHAILLARGLDCTLDQGPRLCTEDADIARAREAVRQTCRAHGLVFVGAA
jgi:glutamate-ammonia-ligase adenylyltransferase